MEDSTKGRKTNPNSARQIKLAAKAEAIANGTSIKPGRAADPNSKRQLKLAAKAAAVASGETVTKGRPKKATTNDVLASVGVEA